MPWVRASESRKIFSIEIATEMVFGVDDSLSRIIYDLLSAESFSLQKQRNYKLDPDQPPGSRRLDILQITSTAS